MNLKSDGSRFGPFTFSHHFNFSALPELWVLSRDDAHLQLRRLEVDGEDGRQAGDRRLRGREQGEKVVWFLWQQSESNPAGLKWILILDILFHFKSREKGARHCQRGNKHYLKRIMQGNSRKKPPQDQDQDLGQSSPEARLYLHRLLKGPVQFFLHFLLQEAGGFRLLHPGGGGLEAAVVPGGVALVHLRAVLLVDADDDHTCGRSDAVREHQGS